MDALNDALDCGLSEQAFWDMSFDEIHRYKESYKRRYRAETKRTISYLYNLADMTALSVARIHNSNAVYPPIDELYPDLFAEDNLAQARLDKEQQLSVERFLQFAQIHNKKLKEAEQQ